MKVTLPKDYRKTFTLEEVENAKRMIKAFKVDYEADPKEEAALAVRHWINKRMECGAVDRVLEATATVAKNCRTWNMYDDTGDLDVWIDAVVKVSSTWDESGYAEVGFYITDLWQVGPNDVDITPNMYVQYFKRGS